MKYIEAPKDDLRERFILFLASKPANQSYYWADQKTCACGTFIRECLERVTVRQRWFGLFNTVRTYPPVEAGRVWKRWNEVARIEPHTYGALLERVRDVATA